MNQKPLTHLDEKGAARMVDVGDKEVTAREAVATATLTMREATARRLRAGDTPKGDVLATARIAGIQAAKRTPEWIPLCHGIALTSVTVDLEVKRAAKGTPQPDEADQGTMLLTAEEAMARSDTMGKVTELPGIDWLVGFTSATLSK